MIPGCILPGQPAWGYEDFYLGLVVQGENGRLKPEEPKSCCYKTEKKAVTNVSNQWLVAKQQLQSEPSSEAGREMLCFPLRLERAICKRTRLLCP